MGKLEVRGNASKTVDYDLMKIKLDFHAKEKTATEASQKVMRECEGFLGILKKGGVNISNISLSNDSVDRSVDYHNDGEREYYRANRILEIESEFNMKMINDIRTITNEKPLEVVEAYVRENTTELVDSLDVQKKIAQLQEKRDTLLTELDTQIKVSNATTFIEI